jgi:hypothetical protein
MYLLYVTPIQKIPKPRKSPDAGQTNARWRHWSYGKTARPRLHCSGDRSLKLIWNKLLIADIMN